MTDHNLGTWREVFLRAVHAGESVGDAARKAGVDPRAASQSRSDDPGFAQAVERARTAARQRRIDALLEALVEGLSLTEAATRAGIALPTLKRWRRQELDLDARVLAAAAQGGHRLGGRTQMRPARALACPGPRCGTTTGYDYGCREAACITAKTAPSSPDARSDTMSTTPETTGYEAEPTEVAAEIAWLDEITDPLERYHRATAAQAHHEAVVDALAQVREQALARMNSDGLSLRKLADLIGTSPGRVQELLRRDQQRDTPRGENVVVTVSRADRVHEDPRGRYGEIGGPDQYEYDRGWWRVGAEVRDKARHAVFAAGGTVLRGYEITGDWEPDGAGKWAFTGRLLSDAEFDALHQAGQIPLARGESCPPRRGTYRPVWFTAAP